MYTPAHFREERPEVLHDFMRCTGFATLVTAGEAGLRATHLPLLLDDSTESPQIRGHLARANPQWRDLDAGVEALVIYQGPQAYVSPSFYPSKKDHGKVVPTWNYLAVHAYGKARCFEDRDKLLTLLNALTDHHEQGRLKPWQVSDAPAAYIEAAAKAIVGFELEVARLAGTWKLSQNRSAEDRRGVADGLRSGDAEDQQVARLIPE